MEAGYARSSGIWWDQLQINDTYARTLQLYTAGAQAKKVQKHKLNLDEKNQANKSLWNI